jgi:hypothetical protein
VKFWTAHTVPRRAPVLLREGFSLRAMLFGPLWLLAWRAWIPAILVLCTELVCAALTHGTVRVVVIGGVAWLVGLCGRDMVRWSLERRGYTLAHVVAARDEEGALGRLLEARPDLAAGFAA